MSQATTGIETALRRETSLGAAQVIRSPEQVALDLEVAGPMSRMLAFSIDYGIVLVVEMVILTALVFAATAMANLEQLEQVSVWIEETQAHLERGELDFGPWILLMLAVWVALDFLLQWGYFVACELTMQGRSPGKALIGLRVVRDGGLPVTLRESLLRNLVRMVDMLPTQYFIGLVSMVLSKDVRRLGDYAAGTLVIRDARAEPARPIEVGRGPSRHAVFRFDREQLAAVGPVELRLARQTLRRIDELPTWKAREVLDRTTRALCTRLDFGESPPPEQQRDFLLTLLEVAEGR
jgi:uncharacterized RDD family membrane protein YckC